MADRPVPRRRQPSLGRSARPSGTTFDVYDPYRLVAREFRSAIDAYFSREEFRDQLLSELEASKAGDDLETWRNPSSRRAILYGKRKPSARLLECAARVLLRARDAKRVPGPASHDQTEPADAKDVADADEIYRYKKDGYGSLVDRLTYLADRPNCSLVGIERCQYVSVNIGYVQFHPFLDGATSLTGLIPELTRLLFRQLEMRFTWVPLSYSEMLDALDSRRVDLVAGFIMETHKRRLKATFIDLDLPMRVGINAIAPRGAVPERMTYEKAMKALNGFVAGRDSDDVAIVTIKGEVGSEYANVILDDGLQHRHADIDEPRMDTRVTIREHLRRGAIVLADHVTCHKVNQDSPKDYSIVFKTPIGRLRGGFLSPQGDHAWAETIRDGFRTLMEGRFPNVIKIIDHYALPTSTYLDIGAAKEWLIRHWDTEIIDEPASWLEAIKRASTNKGKTKER